MRRILLGVTLGALIFGVAFAGAKVATVTNPMSADLDANGFVVKNAGDYFDTSGSYFGGGNLQLRMIQMFENEPYTGGARGGINVGTGDPRGDLSLNEWPGSLYLQNRGDTVGGAFWVKTGPRDDFNAWTCVAGCTP